ncbi:exopolysaccharide biosynthesis polyprenyl glycosylphosphotransferase [Marinobacterium mangrovicola]|uniref:Exopolysaccharide biosynthesis polyprenyl glycosylphosphotransferase n=1 Tax=Marinobacterium mangrovicola TaxID=1476959 RepID=A0A4R1GRI2_9GAMM|nr:exopolysaccharide biosynthesis polyprenyl glycosylphosphotransferase [Marinobacterium mangrovicola]
MISRLAVGVVGLILGPLVVALMMWSSPQVLLYPDNVQFNSLIAIALTYLLCNFTLSRLITYPGTRAKLYILPIVTLAFMLTSGFFLASRLGYSRMALVYGWLFTLIWCFVSYSLSIRYRQRRFAVVPFGEAKGLSFPNTVLTDELLSPELRNKRTDAVVVDLDSDELTPEWERFLAYCTLSRIPVYHVTQVRESLTGRVYIDRLSENAFGALLPPALYEAAKRLLDILVSLVAIPLLTPVMLLTALFIRLESPGPALFCQPRVGQGNRDFRIYKFRSMYKDSEAKGAQLATQGDARVTRVGRIIRRLRIDELPQFFNVLKGDMSLIGPRPEQRALVEQFEGEIPFYVYRHVVKPGITGWAQVTQGYAGDVDDTRIKLEYDFYYIKHLSPWLDLLILFKTIRTVLTGFGAR